VTTCITLVVGGDAEIVLPDSIQMPSSQQEADDRCAYSIKRAAEVTDILVRKLTDDIAAGQLNV